MTFVFHFPKINGWQVALACLYLKTIPSDRQTERKHWMVKACFPSQTILNMCSISQPCGKQKLTCWINWAWLALWMHSCLQGSAQITCVWELLRSQTNIKSRILQEDMVMTVAQPHGRKNPLLPEGMSTYWYCPSNFRYLTSNSDKHTHSEPHPQICKHPRIHWAGVDPLRECAWNYSTPAPPSLVFL